MGGAGVIRRLPRSLPSPLSASGRGSRLHLGSPPNIMKRLGWILLVLVLAVVLNPSAGKHRATFDEEFSSDHPVLAFLGAGKLASALMVYDNYYVFSTTRVADRVVSVGIFGKVFVLTR